jgi:nucleotide-binding universal stress UspA family protein
MSTIPQLQGRVSPAAPKEMYRTIFVPVDNSPHSNRAVECAVELGRRFHSTLAGCHVYAARMHDYRFKQMEYTLPEEYLEEQELERQRKIHDSLITMGLELISDCYLEDMDRKCREAGLSCDRKMMDGKHSTELIREIEASGYDLVVLGALGIGKVRDSLIGSVCERVARQCPTDIWVVKHLPRRDEGERDTVLVGIDGSPQSFGALRTGVELARRFGKRLELIAVYDPYLHYAVFKGIVDVLTEKASKVFRFEEQNQLHEEIIDTGLAEIYQSHLNVAQAMVRDEGLEVRTTLLDGKCFQKILDHARKTEPWVLIVGRIGIHSSQEETSLGSNSENLLRLSPCDILLSTRLEYPELDLRAEEAVHWTPEAEERMTRVPSMVRNIARTAILRLAVEKGHSVITNALVTEAMERFMPRNTARTTTGLAEQLALQRARSQPVSLCGKCGVAAKVPEPVRCSVCGGADFEVITREMIEKIERMEGGVEEETTYDGRKVRWTQEARRSLHAIADKYQMRRCKARIEKKARMNRLGTISLEFARSVIAEETGKSFLVDPPEPTEVPDPPTVRDAEKRIVARDSKGTPLISDFDWTPDAVERILRVPGGFMRNKTQERIEELVRQRDLREVDLAVVEDGLEIGRHMMAEMIGQYGASREASAAGGDLPASGEAESGRSASPPDTGGPAKGEGGPGAAEGRSPAANGSRGGGSPALNETGWMSEMARRRKTLLE